MLAAYYISFRNHENYAQIWCTWFILRLVMTSPPWHTVTHGKWLLAGEHAVVRGHQALVFPLISHMLVLCTGTAPAAWCGTGPYGTALQPGLRQMLQYIAQHFGEPAILKQSFHLYSALPPGTGLGSSAALCVALARWLVKRGLLSQHQLISFAQQMENKFHKQSSGVDLLGVSSSTPQVFQHDAPSETLTMHWKPYWYLSYSGPAVPTAACVAQVQHLYTSNPTRGKALDSQMQACVDKAQRALCAECTTTGQKNLVNAIEGARTCFAMWDLYTPMMLAHEAKLLQAGALAVKPTGAGRGGHMLSIWEAPPSNTVRRTFQLVAL